MHLLLPFLPYNLLFHYGLYQLAYCISIRNQFTPYFHVSKIFIYNVSSSCEYHIWYCKVLSSNLIFRKICSSLDVLLVNIEFMGWNSNPLTQLSFRYLYLLVYTLTRMLKTSTRKLISIFYSSNINILFHYNKISVTVFHIYLID